MEKTANKKIEKISEKILEKKLVEGVKKMGGKALKFSSITDTSYPDRLVLMPGEMVTWVELKTTGCKQTKLQELRSKELREMGFDVFVVDNMPLLDWLLNYLKERSDYATL